jgi:hypothetical protein
MDAMHIRENTGMLETDQKTIHDAILGLGMYEKYRN